MYTTLLIAYPCGIWYNNQMSTFFAGEYDVAVLGAGHAGCESALACARMGLKTLCLTLDLDAVALMACNPAIGGTSKGHLVCELDAMGGEMGLAADETYIQIRMLNTGKGEAVHSLRAQMDKHRYHERMKRALENQENLDLVEGECERILTKNGRTSGIVVSGGARYDVKSVIVASGVYLKSNILIGDFVRESGAFPCPSFSTNHPFQGLAWELSCLEVRICPQRTVLQSSRYYL